LQKSDRLSVLFFAEVVVVMLGIVMLLTESVHPLAATAVYSG